MDQYITHHSEQLMNWHSNNKPHRCLALSAERVLCARMEADVDLVGGHVRSCLVSYPVAVGRRLTVHSKQRLLYFYRTQPQMDQYITTLGSAQAFQISRHPTRVLFKTFVALPTGVGISFSQRREPRAYPLPPPPLSPPSVVVIAGGQHPAPMQPASRFFNNSA